MTASNVVCPYCGKVVTNSEKLARHLARECSVVSTQEEIRQSDDSSQEGESQSGHRS